MYMLNSGRMGVCEFIACVDFMSMSEEAGVSCMSCQE